MIVNYFWTLLESILYEVMSFVFEIYWFYKNQLFKNKKLKKHFIIYCFICCSIKWFLWKTFILWNHYFRGMQSSWFFESSLICGTVNSRFFKVNFLLQNTNVYTIIFRWHRNSRVSVSTKTTKIVRPRKWFHCTWRTLFERVNEQTIDCLRVFGKFN